MLHRGRRSRTLCQTDEDMRILAKTVARLDFGSDAEQVADADAQQAEAVAGAACSVASVHDVSSGLAHTDRGAASGVGEEHSVPVRHDEEDVRCRDAESMEHGERGERGDTGERIESGEEDEGKVAAGAEKGGGSSIQGGVKKKKPQRRSKGAKNHWQRQEAAQRARRGSAMQGTPILPSGV